MIKNPLKVIVLDGTMYDMERLKDATGFVIEIWRVELNTDINCSEIDTGLHALTVERAEAGDIQSVGSNPELYVSEKTDNTRAIKYKGNYLLLHGHKQIEGTSAKVKVFLTTTVALKNARAKIDTSVPVPIEAPQPIPAPSYPNDFRNAPKIVAKPVESLDKTIHRKEAWGGEKKVKHYGGRASQHIARDTTGKS